MMFPLLESNKILTWSIPSWHGSCTCWRFLSHQLAAGDSRRINHHRFHFECWSNLFRKLLACRFFLLCWDKCSHCRFILRTLCSAFWGERKKKWLNLFFTETAEREELKKYIKQYLKLLGVEEHFCKQNNAINHAFPVILQSKKTFSLCVWWEREKLN